MSHQKPTKEELEARNKELLEELDEEEEKKDQDDEEEDDSENDDDEEERGGEDDDEKSDDEEESEEDEDDDGDEKSDDESDEDEEKEDKKDDLTDYKKRHEESTKEAQKLYKANTTINDAIVDAENLPEPTEDELKAAYPKWDEMDEFSKDMAKEAFINRRFRNAVKKAAEVNKEIKAWNDKVDDYIDDPKITKTIPQLAGKEDAFRAFATKKEYRGSPLTLITSAFLHELETNKRPKNKGSMFESGRGGPSEKRQPNDGKISVEEGAKLKKKNYKEYIKMLRAGKIREEVD